jgi:hypothetical protein
VTHLNAPKLFSPSAWPWIAWRATWWATKGEGLEWKPISLYRPYLDERMAIASPVLLRDATRWLYGSRVGNEWWRFSEGGSWPIDGFEPTLWCEPPLDDGTMLGRE